MKKILFFLFFFSGVGCLTFGEGRLLISKTGQPIVILDINYLDQGIVVDDQVRNAPDSLIYKALAFPGDTIKLTARSFFAGMDGVLENVQDEYNSIIFDGRRIYFITSFSKEYTTIPYFMIAILSAVVSMIFTMLFSKRSFGLFALLSFCLLFAVFFAWLMTLFSVEKGVWIVFTGFTTLVSAWLVAYMIDKRRIFWFKVFLLTIIGYFIAIYTY